MEGDPYDYLDDEDAEPEELGFQCEAYWVEGKSEGAGYWHCPIAGTEDCDWHCPGHPGDQS
jgi:hypothetical protein